MKKERIGWIDISRGIGILLVVYGHAISAGELRAFIYSFHMPLFFLLSGLVFRYKKEESLRVFTLKNARNILVPYIVFAVLSFLLWYVTKHPTMNSAIFQFGSIFYGNGNNNLLQFNNILWFLPCLFLVRMGFYVLTRECHTAKSLSIALLVTSILGYVYSLFFSWVKLPFGAETALDAVVFFGGGYLLYTSYGDFQKKLTTWRFILLLIFVGICVLFAMLNFKDYGVQVDLRKDILNNYLYFYVAAFAGTFATLLLSMCLKHNRLLEYLGKQSLVIFAWHLLAFPYVSKLLGVLHVKPLLAQAPLYVSPVVWSVTSILIVLCVAVPVQYSLAKVLRKRSQE